MTDDDRHKAAERLCKSKTPYKWGPWHAYTNGELEELDREDFHRHVPSSEDDPARLSAIDVWNRRASDDGED